MNKHNRVFIISALLILLIIISKLFVEYKSIEELKVQIVKEEAKSLSAFMIAFRQIYQNAFINNHIPIDEKTINLLPVRTTKAIGDRFSKIINNSVSIKTVSDRPRNPVNKANSQEMKIINYFNKNKDEKFYFEDYGADIYYYAQPLYIEKNCLKCHGKREEAILTIRDNYDKAYDYKLGDLRGILSIKLLKSEIIENIDNNYSRSIKVTVIIYFLFLFALYILIKIIIKNEDKYRKILEEKIQNEIGKNEKIQELYREIEESEYELQLLNENLEIKVKEEVEKNITVQEHLFKSEKMVSMGEMIGNIAHQWRQPLSIISTSATGMQLKKEHGLLTDEQFNKTCTAIDSNAQYLSKTIDDFKNYIRGDRILVSFFLKENIDSFLHLVESSIKNNHLNIILDAKDDIKIKGYPNELIQCYINIFNNSKDVLTELDETNRFIFISISQDEDNCIIKIKDNGGGIPENVMDKIFEPYFTTKHKSQGTGLGLHMTYSLIVEGMGGVIEVCNVDYVYKEKNFVGAEFLITLPNNKN